MSKQKKSPDGLSIHDRVEGASEGGHGVFAEVCAKLSTKQVGDIAAHRVLNGSRRVTRDLLVAAMQEAGIEPDEQEALWGRYFGGPPRTIPEFVRRRAIIAGGVHVYAEAIGTSHETISHIMRNRVVTLDTLVLILAKEAQHLPWDLDRVHRKWRREYEGYLMRRDQINLLAARIRLAFDMHPHISLSAWMSKDGKLPQQLTDKSKNAVKNLVRDLRNGIPAPWADTLRVLDALGCSQEIIAEIERAWKREYSRTQQHGEPEILSEVAPLRRSAAQLRDGDAVVTGTSPGVPVETADGPQRVLGLATTGVSPPAHTASMDATGDAPALLPNATATTDPSPVFAPEASPPGVALQVEAAPATPSSSHDLTPEEVTPVPTASRRRRRRVPRVPTDAPPATPLGADVPSEVLQTEVRKPGVQRVDASPPAPRIHAPVEAATYATPEIRLFGEESELVRWDIDELPDFADIGSVWLLGEYLQNFRGRGSAGFRSSEDAFTVIAQAVQQRAPLGINDTANAIKMLTYCYGRFPDHAGTKAIIDSLDRSCAALSDSLPRLMQRLVKEPRISAFLVYYRDTHPDSPVTQCLRRLCALHDVLESPRFHPEASEKIDIDYEGKSPAFMQQHLRGLSQGRTWRDSGKGRKK